MLLSMSRSMSRSIPVKHRDVGSDSDVLSASIRLTLEHPIYYLPDGEGGEWDRMDWDGIVGRRPSNSSGRSITLFTFILSWTGYTAV